MRRSEALQGVRVIKFRSVLDRYESSERNQREAAELLGIGERTFRRWQQRYEEAGEAGLLDRRLGRASGKRVPRDREEEVERLYRTRYRGFTTKFSTSTWCGIMVSAGATRGPRRSCNRRGLWSAPRGAAHTGAAAATAVAWDDASSGRVAP
jgi:Helix-turn-helix domain